MTSRVLCILIERSGVIHPQLRNAGSEYETNTYTRPRFVQRVDSGNWRQVGTDSRHYSISDGALSIKTTVFNILRRAGYFGHKLNSITCNIDI